jgi:hypothetical protein
MATYTILFVDKIRTFATLRLAELGFFGENLRTFRHKAFLNGFELKKGSLARRFFLTRLFFIT